MSNPALELGRELVEDSGTTSLGDMPDVVEADELLDVSDLDQLRKDFAAGPVVEECPLPVDTRPGYVAVYRADVQDPDMKAYRKLAKSPKEEGGIDGKKLAALILANKCIGIYRNGRKLVDADRTPVTFGSDSFKELTGAKSAADAVVRFYGLDGLLDSHSRKVLEASKWGEEADEDGFPTEE
jgi:hypothetical protein